MKDNLERKLKRERIEVCLNCKHFVECNCIGKFDEYSYFEEAEGEAWVIKKI